MAGGTVGVLLSVWGIELLKRVGARTVPRLTEVNVDLTVIVVMAVVAIGTGILFGLLPASASAKPELTEALKEGGRGATGGRRHNQIPYGLVITGLHLRLSCWLAPAF